MWHEYINATSTDEVIHLLAEKRENARVVAGGTDLILELERGVRKDVKTLIDVTRIPHLNQITIDEDDVIHLGALVTHNDCVASELIRKRAYPLARAAWEVGAPQIRNRGTIAGNLITASPANDTITPLMALDANVTLISTRGERIVPLKEFYTGVRKNVMQADEMLVSISFHAMTATQRGTFIKLALRRVQAISLVNVAVILNLKADTVKSASITLGAVTPIITHAAKAEAFLTGKQLTDENIAQAAELAVESATPIDDVRGSANYRREMVRVITKRGLTAIRDGNEEAGMPQKPILLISASEAIHRSRQKNSPQLQLKQPSTAKNTPSPAGTTKPFCACSAKRAC
jgi:CO/xanthine dehydrogenase FAD-binding subunit